MHTDKRGAHWLALAAVIASASPALAQEMRSDAAANTGLEDVIVTARKVEERLQDVPVAVTAFDSAALESKNAVSLSDIGRVAPGLTIRAEGYPNGGSLALFSLRGQTQNSSLATSDPSVGVYVDGVYWARAYGINASLLDVGNVQVLRGPQGTLFGRNTTGGAILIQTNDPTLDEFSGKASLSYGRFDYKAGTAVVNAPIVAGKVAARLAVQAIDDDGYVRDTNFPGRKFGDQHSLAMRGKLLAELSENTSISLSADIFRDDRNPDVGELRYVSPTGSANLEAGAEQLGTAACFANVAACAAAGRAEILDIFANQSGNGRTSSWNIANESKTHTDTYVATLNQKTAMGDLKTVGGYRKVSTEFFSDYDGSPIRISEFGGELDIDQWSGEVTLTGNAAADRLSYAAGLFYFTEKGQDATDFAAFATINPSLLRFDGVIDNRAIGTYGQASYKITDALTFTGGLRWSQDKKQVTIRNGTELGTIYETTPGSFTCTVQSGCPTTREGKFDGISWTAGLDYKINPDFLIYAKAARGFRSGGVNLRETTLINNLPPQAFDPEKVTSFEGGIKTDLFDHRLRMNLAGYYQILRDAQRSFLVSSVFGNTVTNSTVIGNAERADYYGGEAELTALLVDAGADRFTASINAAYTKPEYADYHNPSNGFDKSHEEFPLVPRWTASASGTYEHDFPMAQLSLTATYNWDSGFHYLDFNYYTQAGDPAGIVRNASDGTAMPIADAQNIKHAFRIQSSGTLDLRATLSFGEADRYELALWGRNVLNDRAFQITGPAATLAINGVRRPPATYGVTATAKF